MKILVTGGAGFIGSNFVCKALKDGHQIINVDKLTYAGNLENLEDYANHPDHIFYQEDICNRNNLEQIIFKHNPDVILHMAAESHVDRSIDCADLFMQTNILGTYTLLDISLKYYQKNSGNFKFIYLSTDEVFGALGKNDICFDETMPYRPNSPYAASKSSSDLIVRSYHKTYGLSCITINSSNNYGPKQYPEKLIPLVISNALEQKSLPIYGEGKQIRDWLYVEDHVDALLKVIEKGHLGHSYCIGSNNEISNIELVKLICSILDEIKPYKNSYANLITFVKDRLGHDFRYATNPAKIKDHTGWRPKTNFEEGLKKTIKWYVDKFENFQTIKLRKNL
jgi:dTDP-glucose 4,6-dehydratase